MSRRQAQAVVLALRGRVSTRDSVKDRRRAVDVRVRARGRMAVLDVFIQDAVMPLLVITCLEISSSRDPTVHESVEGVRASSATGGLKQ